MARTDQRGKHGDDQSPHPGMQGVNLPIIPFHGPKEEQLRLLQAVRTHIGPCDCIVHSDMFGNHCQGHPCAGHQFLCEKDDPGRTLEWTVPDPFGFTHFTSGSLANCVTRLDRLMFARTMKWQWVKQEMAGVSQAFWPPRDGWQHDPRNCRHDGPWCKCRVPEPEICRHNRTLPCTQCNVEDNREVIPW